MSAIKAYAREEQGTRADTFAKIIRAMDNEFLSHKREKKTFSRDMMKR